MSAEVIELVSKDRIDQAWKRYVDLVTERAENDLWANLDHNKRIADAWDRWSKLYLAGERNQ